jgi:hypothetical protein
MAELSGPTRFRELFESALRAYQQTAVVTLAEHSLAIQVQSCDTVESVIAVLQGQARAFSEFSGHDRVMNAIKNTLLILTKFSDTTSLAVDIGLVRHQALMTCFTTDGFYSNSRP